MSARGRFEALIPQRPVAQGSPMDSSLQHSVRLALWAQTAWALLTAVWNLAGITLLAALLRLVAGLAEGYAASRGGGGACDPDAINRRADALVAAWVYDVRYARPMPEDVARMIAEAVGLAGVVCRVEVLP